MWPVIGWALRLLRVKDIKRSPCTRMLDSSNDGDEIFSLWGPMPCLLVHSLQQSPVHQQAWYWMCRQTICVLLLRSLFYLFGSIQIQYTIQNVYIYFIIFESIQYVKRFNTNVKSWYKAAINTVLWKLYGISFRVLLWNIYEIVRRDTMRSKQQNATILWTNILLCTLLFKSNGIFCRTQKNLIHTLCLSTWKFLSIHTNCLAIYIPDLIKFRNRVTAQRLPKEGHVRKTRCKTEMQVSHTKEIPVSLTTH